MTAGVFLAWEQHLSVRLDVGIDPAQSGFAISNVKWVAVVFILKSAALGRANSNVHTIAKRSLGTNFADEPQSATGHKSRWRFAFQISPFSDLSQTLAGAVMTGV